MHAFNAWFACGSMIFRTFFGTTAPQTVDILTDVAGDFGVMKLLCLFQKKKSVVKVS